MKEMDNQLVKSADCIAIEKNEIAEIMKCVNEYADFVVKAGAGSGKTYSLVETITNILKSKYELLLTNNQKILCITYTNAAADEIKERIGNTSLVSVSTIHDFLWGAIKDYQIELVELHIEKILTTIKGINVKLSETRYNDLSSSKKEELIVMLKRNKEVYYKIRDLRAGPFSEQLPSEFEEQFNDILRNKKNFKEIANNILRKERLTQTLENIENKKEHFQSVEYDANVNRDRLASMKISHDTLLEYGKQLVEKYEVLRTILVDRFPYILVDEFQDTSPLVIHLLSNLILFKKEKKKDFLVGFFGDEIQNIYDTGIGNQLNNNIKNLHLIEKKYNYRSSEAVIKLANFTRLDSLEQKSAYSNNVQGETNFIVVDIPDEERKEIVDSIVEYYKSSWSVDEENELGIFLTMNKYLSNINGFNNIYDFFNDSPYYKNNWEESNQEIINKNIDDLGDGPKKLYDILYLRNLITKKNSAIYKLISEKKLREMNYFEMQDFYKELTTLDGSSTLSDFIMKTTSLLSDTASPSEGEIWYDILSKFYNLEEDYTYENIVGNIVDSLVARETSDEGRDELNSKLKNLLEDSIEPFENWFNFVVSDLDFNKSISYSTIHGTKGAEFDNVIVILEENFGIRNKKYFKDAISNIINRRELNLVEDEKQIYATNLLYVASTRAKKNITFLFFGELLNDELEVLKVHFDNFYENLEGLYAEPE